jgi:predicted nucleotidyltransferase
MSATRFGLPAEAVSEIGGVLAAHPEVESAILYGSRAKGDYKPGSDIDLTLLGEQLDHHDLLKIMGELDDLLLPYTIDLSIFHMIDHEALRDHIQRVGQEFYHRQNTETPHSA